ncbi:MAG: DUF1643 domain-containing protein [Pseudomonadota bacterium]
MPILENLDLLNDAESTAILSQDGLHRFRLDRSVQSKGPAYAFIGVNPSTADATEDDATVRKWRGFVKRWGGAKFAVANLFSFRATDVRVLATCEHPNVPIISDKHIDAVMRNADVIVPCWGNSGKIPRNLRPRIGEILRIAFALGKPIKCFGLTKSGDPKHPLMLGYDTPLVDYTEEADRGA